MTVCGAVLATALFKFLDCSRRYFCDCLTGAGIALDLGEEDEPRLTVLFVIDAALVRMSFVDFIKSERHDLVGDASHKF